MSRSLRSFSGLALACVLAAACDSRYTSDPAATTDAGGPGDSGSGTDAEADGSAAEDAGAIDLDASTTEGSVDASGGACGTDCHVMFITASTFTGNLGGQAGADQKCKDAAAASKVPAIAARSSRFIAWISTGSSNDPGMTARLPMKLGSFARVDGKVIAGSVSELLSGTIRINIVEDESGSAILTGNLQGASWTGTTASGTTSANTCSDWTSSSNNGTGDIGQASEVNPNWTNAGPVTCNQSKHLYCLEQ